MFNIRTSITVFTIYILIGIANGIEIKRDWFILFLFTATIRKHF